MADKDLVDPLGRTIRFTDAAWYGHAVQQHPDVRRHRRLAEEAITHPKQICISPADADARMYYGKGPNPRLMMLVVADVIGGYLKTAHFVRRTKGAIEWSSPTP
jgi:hypothetical protein